MKIIGLTGNIASGKSTVARLLAERGAAHVDADALVHELYRADSPLPARIAQRFGAAVLAEDGSVDRAALGEIVFNDPEALRALEALVHPETGRLMAERVQAALAAEPPPPALVIEAVKLIESGRYRMADEVWFVRASPETQRERLIALRGHSAADAEARLAAQAPIEPRLAVADRVIDNDGSLDALDAQVEGAWRRLMAE